MTMMTLVVATWLLFSTIFLAACANNQTARVSSTEPNCGNIGYGSTKVAARELPSPASISAVPVGDLERMAYSSWIILSACPGGQSRVGRMV